MAGVSSSGAVDNHITVVPLVCFRTNRDLNEPPSITSDREPPARKNGSLLFQQELETVTYQEEAPLLLPSASLGPS